MRVQVTPGKYTYINTATTTQVKIGRGTLKQIIVNATAAGSIGLIDNTTGTTVNIGLLKASIVEGSYGFNLEFINGLRIVTAGASDITVVYE